MKASLAKKIGGDILERKKTFLYLKALEILDGKKRDDFMFVYNSSNGNEKKIKDIVELYNDICVIGSAKDEIASYTEKANRSLDCIKSSNARDLLERFSGMLLNRSY